MHYSFVCAFKKQIKCFQLTSVKRIDLFDQYSANFIAARRLNSRNDLVFIYWWLPLNLVVKAGEGVGFLLTALADSKNSKQGTITTLVFYNDSE